MVIDDPLRLDWDVYHTIAGHAALDYCSRFRWIGYMPCVYSPSLQYIGTFRWGVYMPCVFGPSLRDDGTFRRGVYDIPTGSVCVRYARRLAHPHPAGRGDAR